jgi:hypothetical protein
MENFDERPGVENLVEVLGIYSFLLVPILIFLWLIPWALVARFMDQSKRQVTLAQILLLTAMCSVVLGSCYWFGYVLVMGGIGWAGIVAFLPARIICWRIGRRQRRLEALAAKSAASSASGQGWHEIEPSSRESVTIK